MAKKSVMKSMEMDDETAIDAPMPIKGKREQYPYGLRISLSEKELETLELDDDDAVVGGICHIHGLARITSVSKSEDAPSEYSKGGKRCRIELQIENMSIDSEDDENEED